MKRWFCTAGKRILIEDAGGDEIHFFRGFEAEEGETFVAFKAELPEENAPPGSADEDLTFGLKISRVPGAYPCRFDIRQGGEYLLASEDLTSCRLFSKPLVTGEKPESGDGEPRWKGLILGALAAKGALFDMLLLHASAVEYRNRAIVFTAPSGTGKTTQAELWKKYSDALILNGDKVFISREEDGFYAYGSPWSGSSPYRENRGARLQAVIVLEQGPVNKIRRLDDTDLLKRLVPNIFLPYWEEPLLDASLTTLDRLLKNVPVYLLTCRADEEAVILTKKTVFEENGPAGEI